MDLIAQGRISENFIEPSYELAETWNGYYSRIMPSRSPASMAYPFSRLKTDGFWERLPRPGYDPKTEYNISSMNRLREVYFGANQIALAEPAKLRRENQFGFSYFLNALLQEGTIQVNGLRMGCGWKV